MLHIKFMSGTYEIPRLMVIQTGSKEPFKRFSNK